MIRRVSVRGFQSLADVDLEFARGITVIVGATGSGKSAFMKALEACFFNRAGASFIRRGAAAATVAVEFDGGAVLTWRKTAGTGGTYQLREADGSVKLITRAGRDTPPDLSDLGIRELLVDDMRVRTFFSGQHDQPFLLMSHTAGQAAKLLAGVSKLDVLVKTQVAARRELERERRQLQHAEDDEARLQTQLEALPDYDEAVMWWEQLERRASEVDSIEIGLVGAQALLDALRSSRDLLAGWEAARLPERVRALSTAVDDLLEKRAVLMHLQAARGVQVMAGLELERRRTELAETEASLHDVLHELGTCPVCGQKVP